MEAALISFVDAVRSASTVVVHFSGHGSAIRGQQYLAPINGKGDAVEGVSATFRATE